jgi:hypothetical protein
MRKTFLMMAAMSAFVVGCGSGSGEPDTGTDLQTSEPMITEPCAADDTFTVWCGYKNPEDLAATPDGKYLLATGFGGIPESILNEMSLVDLATMNRSSVEIELSQNTWGDPSCERGSLDFSTHGLDINQRTDGKYMVAVTNHLPSETVELFELMPSQSSWLLVWRGCVESPISESAGRQPVFNDVALTDDGGFYVTEMYDINTPFDKLIEAGIAGEDTGSVWLWSGDDGFQVIAGSQGSFPNGVVVNDAEDVLYVNYWFSGKTNKLDLTSGKVLATHDGGRADNLTMAQGSVWAEKHDMTIKEYIEGCPADTVNCFLPFSVHELNLDDLSETSVLRFDSEIFGFGTVATPLGDSIWFGSAHGDRVARYDMSNRAGDGS